MKKLELPRTKLKGVKIEGSLSVTKEDKFDGYN